MKLHELVGVINISDFIIIFDTENDGEEDCALYNGTVEDTLDMDTHSYGKLMDREVILVETRELEDTVGPVIQIFVK